MSPTDQCFQHEKGVSLESRYEGTNIFTPCPEKIGFWAQKRAKFGPKLAFWAKYQHFWPIWSNAWPKKQWLDKLSSMVFCYVGTKTLLTPIKIGIFGQKTAKFGPKYAFFGHFRPNIAIFCTFLSNARPKNNVNKVPRWVFRYVGNKTFDFSSKKKDFLPKNDQIWPKIGIFGWYGLGHAGFFGALLAGRLVVVARGLYLARHLFTLSYIIITIIICSSHLALSHSALHLLFDYFHYFI